MTRIFLDFEFTGLHQDTTAISLGIISDCEKTFYAEFNDYNVFQVDQWIEENVLKKLRFSPPPRGQQEHFMACRAKDNPVGNDIYAGYSVELRGHKCDIRKELERWLSQFDRVEVWGDCLAYDWMLFCQIFKHAFNIPKNVYYIPFDLCTLLKSRGIDPDINREDFARGGEYWYTEDQIQKHNTLWDAKVIKACVDRIEKPLNQSQARELNAIPRTNERTLRAKDVAPEQTVVHASFAGQLEREVAGLKWELLDSQNKLNAAQAEIDQLKQNYAGRVNDDQKYLVEPLCSAETQVDELRAELAKKDSLIETILKQLYPLKDHLKRLIFALEMFKGAGIANGWFDGYSKRNFNAIEIAICESEVILKFLRLNGAEAAYQSAGEVNGMNLPEASDGEQKTSKTPRTDKMNTLLLGRPLREAYEEMTEFSRDIERQRDEALNTSAARARIINKQTLDLAGMRTEIERLNKECAGCFNKKRDELIRQMRNALELISEGAIHGFHYVCQNRNSCLCLACQKKRVEAALAAEKSGR